MPGEIILDQTVGPECHHECPYKTEAEEGLTRRPCAEGSRMEWRTLALETERGHEPQNVGSLRKGQETSSPLEAPEGSSPDDTLILASGTDFGLLTSNC